MTSVPYPSFLENRPVDVRHDRSSLVAVGRCRIQPSSTDSEEYREILACAINQAHLDLNDAMDADAKKKIRKRYMKEGVAAAKRYLTGKLQIDVSVVDVETWVNGADLIATDGCLASNLLDAGCDRIVTDGTNVEAIDAAKIPKERLMAHFHNFTTTDNLVAAVDKIKAYVGSISVTLPTHEDLVDKRLVEIIECIEGLEVCLHIDSTDRNIPALVGAVSASLRGPSAHSGCIALVDPTPELLGMSFASCLKTDREDGLFTTVVCTRSGEALGLVYSSKESIVASLECGRGVYHSRSRKGLWRKGDTSGHVQTLHRIDVDCDGDALRFLVTQQGPDHPAFCHLNTLTCWGAPNGIRHLEQVLQDRLKSAPEGSYTKRLFDDPELLRNKLVEEAQELSEASDPQHVAEEFADVLYFCMTRAAKAGVSIDDAVAELDRRARKVTRRKGDSKAFRIAAAQTILHKDDEKKTG